MKDYIPYLLTALICLTIGGYIHMYQSFQEMDIDKTQGELNQFQKYCLDDWKFDLNDYYFSKLEMYILYLCWIVGLWNFMDGILLILQINKKV